MLFYHLFSNYFLSHCQALFCHWEYLESKSDKLLVFMKLIFQWGRQTVDQRRTKIMPQTD